LAIAVCSAAFVPPQAERGVVALKCLEDDVAMERRKDVSWIGEPKSGLNGQSAAEARPAIENAFL
jgi:hypothetical protein